MPQKIACEGKWMPQETAREGKCMHQKMTREGKSVPQKTTREGKWTLQKFRHLRHFDLLHRVRPHAAHTVSVNTRIAD